MYYYLVDIDEVDQIWIGLYFFDELLFKEFINIWIMNVNFKILVGVENYEVKVLYCFWQSGKLFMFILYMYYCGQDMEYVVYFLDGIKKMLFKVDNYDFNWQIVYEFEELVDILVGIVIEVMVYYDNLVGNLDNLDLMIDVIFGDEFYDEMMIVFVDFIVDDGVCLKMLSEICILFIIEVVVKYLGVVYLVSGKLVEKCDEFNSWVFFYLFEEGDGIFYVIWNGDLYDLKIIDVVWDGMKFSGKLYLFFGVFDLKGERIVDGKIIMMIDLLNDDVIFDGVFVEGF